MKNEMMIGAVVAAAALAPAAMAELEVVFSAAELESGFVRVDALNELVGTSILAVGYRDMVIQNTGFTATDFQVGWGMTLPAYGTNFWSLAAPISLAPGQTALDDVLWDVTGYGAEIAAENTWFGEYNIGAGMFGENYVGVGGEMYFILDAVPAPGALALLGLAGVVARRRRA
jgi:MYXO-CTERM domain-containing protein